MKTICLSCILVGLAGAFLSPSCSHRETSQSSAFSDDHESEMLSRRSMLWTATLLVPVVLLPVQASAKVRMKTILDCVRVSRIHLFFAG